MQAPEPGVDPEFDGLVGKIMSALQLTGNPDGITELQARQLLYIRLNTK